MIHSSLSYNKNPRIIFTANHPKQRFAIKICLGLINKPFGFDNKTYLIVDYSEIQYIFQIQMPPNSVNLNKTKFIELLTFYAFTARKEPLKKFENTFESKGENLILCLVSEPEVKIPRIKFKLLIDLSLLRVQFFAEAVSRPSVRFSHKTVLFESRSLGSLISVTR